MRNIIKKQEGFTLLELLIVIVIIGILALLIVPNVVSAPKKSRDTKRKTDLREVKNSLEAYRIDKGDYPADLNTLVTAGELKAVPADPKNTGAYVYTYAPANSNTTYTLTACLENAGDESAGTIAAVAPCTTRTFQLTDQ